jgi:hypothetical protein
MAETCWAYSKDGWVFPSTVNIRAFNLNDYITQNPNSVPVMAVLESGEAGRGEEYFA